jgi:NADPH-dependent curcumin reductase CurA
MRRWYLEGALQCPQVVHEGLDNVPIAFLSLFTGDNGVGKVLVKL